VNLNPTQKSVGELFSERLFRIPDYQRAYSWGPAQRRDLFADIREAHLKNRKHFMATVVARQSDTKIIAGDEFAVVDLIDGQQRITTLVILFKAIAKALENADGENSSIASKLNDLLVKGDNYQAILLQANHGASGIFASYIKKGLIAEDQIKTAADQNLVNAMRECEAFVKSDPDDLGPAEIYARVRNHFIMIYHQIDDESVVYRVFETLNSRGLDVKWLDKTKSQLMALLFEHADSAHNDALQEMRNIWAGVYAALGLDVDRGDEAMRFAGTWKETGRPNKILGEQAASRRLVEIAGTDVQSTVAAAEWLAKVVEKHNTILSDVRLSGVTRINHARFVATAIKLRGWPANIEQELMRKWENVTFRIYGLAGKDGRTSVGEYVRLGYDIIHDSLEPSSIQDRLDQIGKGFEIDAVLDHEDFWSNCYDGWATELRYVLFRYDEYLGQKDGENPDWSKIWQTAASKSIEHISPQSKGKSWVHELGNLTMLPPGMNSSLKDTPPTQKAGKYQTVGVRGTAIVGKTIEKNDQWKRKDVQDRTNRIAAFVKEHWGD
tara:strand:- start:16499 stop:18154 length:1656 start_codon:yes stop_codon:yes gene_type:complete